MYGKFIKTNTPEEIEDTIKRIEEEIMKTKRVLEL